MIHPVDYGDLLFIEQIGKNDPIPGNSIWFGIEETSSLFTGRGKELDTLHQSLTRSESISDPKIYDKCTVISGLGGIGKSTLAKVYARKQRNYYDRNGIWINAENVESLRNSIIQFLTSCLHFSEDQVKTKSDSDLIKIIYNHFKNSQCLIILDNVEDVNVLQLLPKDQEPDAIKPFVLITSRISKWRIGVQVLHLHVLTMDEAVEFIGESIPESNSTDEGKKVLAETLQCLPLALQQAVAYIRAELSEYKDPIREYLKLFESVPKLLDYSNEDEMDNIKTVFITWTMTMNKIQQDEEFGHFAIKIMNLISFFEPDSIPTEIFIKNAIDNTDQIQRKCNGAVGILKKYSMVNGEIGIINIHRLVQRVIRINIQPEPVLLQGIELLFEYMHPDRNNDELLKSLLSHAESLWRHGMKYQGCVRQFSYFPSYMCDKLNYYGRYNAMFTLARDSKVVIQNQLGETNENTIRIKYSEANALFLLKNYPDSLIILNCTYPVSKSLLGSNHPFTLDISNLKALNLTEEGKYSEALEMYNEQLGIKLKKNGLEDRNTLATLTNKGTALYKLERYGEALGILQNVYELRVKLFGEEDALTLRTRYWIAQVLFGMGKISEALGILESVLEARNRILGEDHPSTLMTLQSIQKCKELLSET